MDRNIKNATGYLSELATVLAALDTVAIDAIVEQLYNAFLEERGVFIFGNGGSAALASHMACDFGKGISAGVSDKRMRVLALTDNQALISAWANDVSFDAVFREQLRNFCAPSDVLFAVSGSGNSPNVLRALEYGHSRGTKNLGMTGYVGGKMKPLCDHCLVIPSENMQFIEDAHLVAAHAIATALHNRIADGSSRLVAAASSAGRV